MFKRILIANRGEIAVRIIRACQELGIETVAVYSSADADALHVQLADIAVCIGPPAAVDSYLNMQNILSATILTGATAIHPGYGLLSENPKFARICSQCNITFIGPHYESMELMGNKLEARRTMISAGVPVVPGSRERIETLEQAIEDAENAGYPVLVKAASGGGGRGIRQVNNRQELENAIETAKAEAKVCFGDDDIYIEKMITDCRHIEVQVISDSFENHVHLYERDCSMQMRRQKLIEESPCSFIDSQLRERICQSGLNAAKAVNYLGAGTIEFLLDKNNNYYFMEMNTRLQVEHTVTEMVTGVDIVKEQILIAQGNKLSFNQEDIHVNGCAIECRVNAVDVDKNFMASCGTVELVHVPSGPGVRFDSMLYNGCNIVPHYDSMIGKIIVHEKDRMRAILRMKRALNELVINGICINTDFQQGLISSNEFISGNFNITTVETNLL